MAGEPHRLPSFREGRLAPMLLGRSLLNKTEKDVSLSAQVPTSIYDKQEHGVLHLKPHTNVSTGTTDRYAEL